jgi:hypothetical protein
MMSNAANIEPTSAEAGRDDSRQEVTWLFSPVVDLMTFLGSAVLSLFLLAVGHWAGILHSVSPGWTWISTVLLVDVAHVYATCWRVYFDPEEFRRRRALYVMTPVIIFFIGWAIHSESAPWFWRILAYMSVFHFVRQQYGWVALYRARAKEPKDWRRWLDTFAIYAASVYPLVWWHVHLPRKFAWMASEDFLAGFAQLPLWIESVCAVLYWLILATYFGTSLYRGLAMKRWNPGKDIVVATTAICWYIGIITFNSDYAFTVTNVIIHGVPYFVLVYWYRNHWSNTNHTTLDNSIEWDTEFDADPIESDDLQNVESNRADQSSLQVISPRIRRIVIFVGTLWLLAFVEEFLWHRGVGSSRAWLFGESYKSLNLKVWLVPLLAVPQLTHYVLDGFIWRRRSNPDFDRRL